MLFNNTDAFKSISKLNVCRRIPNKQKKKKKMLLLRHKLCTSCILPGRNH